MRESRSDLSLSLCLCQYNVPLAVYATIFIIGGQFWYVDPRSPPSSISSADLSLVLPPQVHPSLLPLEEHPNRPRTSVDSRKLLLDTVPPFRRR